LWHLLRLEVFALPKKEKAPLSGSPPSSDPRGSGGQRDRLRSGRVGALDLEELVDRSGSPLGRLLLAAVDVSNHLVGEVVLLLLGHEPLSLCEEAADELDLCLAHRTGAGLVDAGALAGEALADRPVLQRDVVDAGAGALGAGGRVGCHGGGLLLVVVGFGVEAILDDDDDFFLRLDCLHVVLLVEVVSCHEDLEILDDDFSVRIVGRCRRIDCIQDVHQSLSRKTISNLFQQFVDDLPLLGGHCLHGSSPCCLGLEAFVLPKKKRPHLGPLLTLSEDSVIDQSNSVGCFLT